MPRPVTNTDDVVTNARREETAQAEAIIRRAAREVVFDQMEPGRHWRAHDADGNLLAESSNEREIRLIARKTKGATLHRSFHIELAEWRQVVPK